MVQLPFPQKGEELYSMMATGRKYLRWHSVVNLGNPILRLKVLLYDSIIIGCLHPAAPADNSVEDDADHH